MLRVTFAPLFVSVSPLPESILSPHPPTLLCRELAQGRSTFGYGVLAAWLTFAAAKVRGFQARASLSALHFSELIGFSISFSMAQHGLVELEKQQRFLSQWCNGRRLQSIFWECWIQLYYIFRTIRLLCLLNHMKDYEQCYFSETLYRHWN